MSSTTTTTTTAVMKRMESISDLRVLKKIGAGKTSEVFIVKDYDSNSFALKKLRSDRCSAISVDVTNEVKVLCEIGNHQNIPKVHFFDGQHIVLDFVENGELFEYISTGSRIFDEDLARFYFTQLVSVFEFLKTAGVAHRDIKPENILIDQDYNLKICDFGYACYQKEGEKLDQIIGTDGYMAPELLKGRSYDGFKVDVFALGVVLFCMVNGFPPYFKKATSNDPYYRFFREKRTQIYWQSLQRKYNREYSEEFMDLITSMLAYKPSERPNIDEIRTHPWLNGKTLITKEEAMTKMKAIKASLPPKSA